MAKVAGSLWVEGNNLHYVDAFNREWYSPGTFIKNVSGALPGSIWQDSGTTAGIYWVNQAGTAIYRTPVTHVKLIPLGPPITSIWVEQSSNYLSWLWYYDGTRHQVLNNHWDVATVNTHGDAHTDGAHVDVPHVDNPHVDVPPYSNHDDWHNDTPHSDFWDSAHGDTPAVNFGDHNDCWRDTVAPGTHFDGPTRTRWEHADCNSSPYGPEGNPYGPTHYDEWTFGDHTDGAGGAPPGHPDHWDYGQHWDFAHDDWHADSPHQDTPPHSTHGDYWDSVAHSDSPHGDAHSDAVHQDAHTDSHGDVAHIDQPILIGP